MSAAEEVVEEVVEAAVEGLYVSKSGLVRVGVVVGLLTTGAGFLGYKIAEKRLSTKYEELAEKEIAEAKEFYRTLNKKDEFATPEDALRTLAPEQLVAATEALRTYQGEETEEGGEEVVVESSVNVFLQNEVDDTFDLEEEIASRDPNKPYIISQQEFLENQPDFEQTTLTYYEGDGALADEADDEIPFADPIVGEENLQRFGHGSGDARLVYVRNERLSTDFEVAKSDGKFAHEVLGMELEHSHNPGNMNRSRRTNRKFRGDDE